MTRRRYFKGNYKRSVCGECKTVVGNLAKHILRGRCSRILNIRSIRLSRSKRKMRMVTTRGND